MSWIWLSLFTINEQKVFHGWYFLLIYNFYNHYFDCCIFIATSHCFIHMSMMNLAKWKNRIMSKIIINSKLNDAIITYLNIFNCWNFIFGSGVTYWSCLKELLKVFKRDPGTSVVGIVFKIFWGDISFWQFFSIYKNVLYTLFCFRMIFPFVRFITPISFPFFITPRISDQK